jgi:hypothetical protein
MRRMVDAQEQLSCRAREARPFRITLFSCAAAEQRAASIECGGSQRDSSLDRWETPH